MTDDEFAELTKRYIIASDERVAFIKAGVPTNHEELETYRQLADHEWELGLEWDEELVRQVEH
jgi:hypothetical protein